MKILRLLAVSVCLFFCAVHAALAFNESGHLQIAAVAYGQLSDQERTAVDAILSKHVKFSTWNAEYGDYRARTPDAQEVSQGFFVFTRASVYPDEIRDYDNPETHAYWHFITYPLKSPNYAFKAALSPTTNIVVGIEESFDIANDEHQSAVKRAKYLSFLIHLVGDIHQPHPCGSLFNSRFTQKDGDKGGNRFYVKETAGGATKNLHSLWDGLLGSGDDPDNMKTKAAQLVNAHSRSSMTALLAVEDATTWAKMSRSNAVAISYKKFSSVTPTQANPVLLPQGWKADAKAFTEKSAALAGYRLADMIKTLVADQ